MLKPFKRNVFRLQMIKRFVRAAFRQITLTTRYWYFYQAMSIGND